MRRATFAAVSISSWNCHRTRCGFSRAWSPSKEDEEMLNGIKKYGCLIYIVAFRVEISGRRNAFINIRMNRDLKSKTPCHVTTTLSNVLRH